GARRAGGHRRQPGPARTRLPAHPLRQLLRQPEVLPVLGQVLPAPFHLPLEGLTCICSIYQASASGAFSFKHGPTTSAVKRHFSASAIAAIKSWSGRRACARAKRRRAGASAPKKWPFASAPMGVTARPPIEAGAQCSPAVAAPAMSSSLTTAA